MVTSMSVTDVGNEMCWWSHTWSYWWRFIGHFSHQHLISFYISVDYQHSKYMTSEMSSISKFSHQHPQIITNFKSQTSMLHHDIINITIWGRMSGVSRRRNETVFLNFSFWKNDLPAFGYILVECKSFQVDLYQTWIYKFTWKL